MIFDTHCHLFDESFNNDLEEVIQRAKQNNITKMLVLGDTLDSSKKAIELASKYENIYAAIGIFPTSTYEIDIDQEIKELESLAKNKKVKCIGEIGLEFYYEKDEIKRKRQIECLIKQIELANRVNLPVSIHARDAIEEIYNILKEHPVQKGVIMHCFSSSKEMMENFVKLGCYIALGGPVTFKNAKTPKEVALFTPLEKLLVETDAPYLAPIPYRGKRNEPSFISNTLCEIAKIKNITFDELSKITYDNACLILGI